MTANLMKIIGISGTLFLSACSTGPSEYDMFRVTQDDVLILEGAKTLLASRDKWIRNEETQCDLDATTWTLFCALQKSSNNVLGEYQLRRPALEEVRMVVEEMAGQTFERRLIDFNNRPETTFEDIHKALDIALERIKARLPAS